MKCRNFDTCSASLCPHDPVSVRNSIWYPGEHICTLVNVPSWVKRQRKVSRLASDTGYFNAEMLGHVFIIRKGIRGLDPERPAMYRAEDVKKWLADHPAISEEKRTEMRERAMKNLPSSSGDNTSFKASRRAFNGVSEGIQEITPSEAGRGENENPA